MRDGAPDSDAVQAFLGPTLDQRSGGFAPPVWSGPDQGGGHTQAFDIADGSLTEAAFAARTRPIAIADSVYFDSVTPAITGLYIPGHIDHGDECRLAIDFDQYPMPVSAAASGGGTTATSASGGASTTPSGGGSTTGGGSHYHPLFIRTGDPGGFALNGYSDGSGSSNVVDLFSEQSTLWSHAESSAHTHASPNHAHATPNHTHDTTLAGHTHDTTLAGHTHALTATATKEAYPASHSVNLTVYLLVTGSWVQQGSTITGITTDAPDIDLTALITGPGRWRIVLQSAAGQPNGGRIGAHLSGYFVGVIPTGA
jgi:hypothetical protein